MINQIEIAKGYKTHVGLEALIETALGMANVEAIASFGGRREALHFGVADYAASLKARTGNIGGRDPDYPREDQAVPVNARLLDYVRQAISIAPVIAGNLDYIRIDFLVTDNCLYAGEIVVYPGAGYGTTTNPAFAGEIERLWRLDQSAFLRRRHKGIVRLYADALRARFEN